MNQNGKKDPVMPCFKMQLLENCLICLAFVQYALNPDVSMKEIHADRVPIDTLLLSELF